MSKITPDMSKIMPDMSKIVPDISKIRDYKNENRVLGVQPDYTSVTSSDQVMTKAMLSHRQKPE